MTGISDIELGGGIATDFPVYESRDGQIVAEYGTNRLRFEFNKNRFGVTDTTNESPNPG